MRILQSEAGPILAVVLLLAMAANADAPPDAGYTRVSIGLVLGSEDEFPEYRFFVKSGADLKEIVLTKGERQTIGPLGGGAYYRNGSVLAVPRNSLVGLNETPANGKLSEMQQAVYDGKAKGTIELVKHSFTRDVSVVQGPRVSDAVYRLEKDGDTRVKAVLVSGGANSGDAGSGFGFYSKEIKSPMFWATVVGASLLSLAMISLGVWAIRRSKAKASQ